MDILQRVYEALGGGEAALTILIALIALVGALAGAFASYLVAGRSVYINSITAERSKWIEKLRTNIASYSALLAEEVFILLHIKEAPKGTAADAAKLTDVLVRINNTVSVIQLQLNPWGEIDRNILKLIESVTVRWDTDSNLINRADQLLIGHAQWLLKAEWEKVKFEAHGWLYRLLNYWRAPKRLRAYQKWALKEGSLDDLIERFALERAKPAAATPATPPPSATPR